MSKAQHDCRRCKGQGWYWDEDERSKRRLKQECECVTETTMTNQPTPRRMKANPGHPLMTIKILILSCIVLGINAYASEKYTAQEIEELRSVVEQKYMWGTSLPIPNGACVAYRNSYLDQKDAVVEKRVQTYMLAGIKAKDIREAEKKQMAIRTKPTK